MVASFWRLVCGLLTTWKPRPLKLSRLRGGFWQSVGGRGICLCRIEIAGIAGYRRVKILALATAGVLDVHEIASIAQFCFRAVRGCGLALCWWGGTVV